MTITYFKWYHVLKYCKSRKIFVIFCKWNHCWLQVRKKVRNGWKCLNFVWNLHYEWYIKNRHIRRSSIPICILFLNEKVKFLLTCMSNLSYIDFPSYVCGQKFFSNHWPSRCFLGQLLITFSFKVDSDKGRVDLLYCRGWNRWINRYFILLICMRELQKLFIMSCKLEPSPWNALGILFTCFHSANV